MDTKDLMKEKIALLNEASRFYYQEANEMMSNLEYDRLYDELVQLEKKTGIILSNSPTQNVGYEILSELPKERHSKKMLSLDKTKDRENLKSWLGDMKGVLSWKLDGLTVVLTYENGCLIKAVTRGNGEIGEVITNNAKVFGNIPLTIPYNEKLVLRGEAIITYSQFEKINSSITDIAAKYKNPRNLCSGSVRQLNNEITKQRNVMFFAFGLVEVNETVEFNNSRANQLEWLKDQGFQVVQFEQVDKGNILFEIEKFEKNIVNNDFPSDGLVLLYDDIEYGEKLGTTAKFPRDAMAFKWKDQLEETVLNEVEWSASRTGLINPVAIFEPVELEGTIVSRASVHNLSMVKQLKLGLGDKITVYKANMIIPQIEENLTKSNNLEIPKYCPVCMAETLIKNDKGVETLVCPNLNCLAKQIKSFTHFVSRDAINIEGLSEATIEKLIAKGLIKELADLFHVDKFKSVIINMEGFGEKSFANLVNSIDKARKTTPERLLYSLGIANIGIANAKLIARACDRNFRKMRNLHVEELVKIDGIGDVMAEGYTEFFNSQVNCKIVDDILQEVDLDETIEKREDFLQGMTFVITGSLDEYANRDVLKAEIESAGGKVSGSISSKTSYLVNNDVTSNSGKNKKAKELGIEIIEEATIKDWLDRKQI